MDFVRMNSPRFPRVLLNTLLLSLEQSVKVDIECNLQLAVCCSGPSLVSAQVLHT